MPIYQSRRETVPSGRLPFHALGLIVGTVPIQGW